MSTELAMLDLAERGQAYESRLQEYRVRGDEQDTQVASDQMAPAKRHVDQLQKQDLEQASGPEGLAQVKDYDRRFAFYPSFSVERSLALEFRAKCISRLSVEIQTLRRELESENAAQLPNLAPPGAVEGRLEGLILQLTERLAQYDAAWVHAKTVESSDTPEQSSLDELRTWLCQRSTGQVELYTNKEWHEFRLLAPAKGPIDLLVKAIMPLSSLGRAMLRPFRSQRVHVDNLRILRYEDTDLSWLVSVLLLVGICVFLILPLALLSYFEANRNFRMALSVIICFLISVFARVIEPDEARQVLFVCVYSAVMSALLSQLS